MGGLTNLRTSMGGAMPDDHEQEDCTISFREESSLDELHEIDLERERVKLRALSQATTVAVIMPLLLFALISGCILSGTPIPNAIYAVAACCLLGFFAILASGFPAVHALTDRLLKLWKS